MHLSSPPFAAHTHTAFYPPPAATAVAHVGFEFVALAWTRLPRSPYQTHPSLILLCWNRRACQWTVFVWWAVWLISPHRDYRTSGFAKTGECWRFSCLVTVEGIFCSIYSSNSDYSQPVLQSETSYKRGPGIRPVWPADCHQSQGSYRTFLVWLNMMSFLSLTCRHSPYAEWASPLHKHRFSVCQRGCPAFVLTAARWVWDGLCLAKERKEGGVWIDFFFFFKGESVTGELCIKSCSLTFLILEEPFVGLNPGQIAGAVGLFIRLDTTINYRRSF